MDNSLSQLLQSVSGQQNKPISSKSNPTGFGFLSRQKDLPKWIDPKCFLIIYLLLNPAILGF